MKTSISRLLAPTLLSGLLLILGCADQDRRLVEDEKSCLQMGHPTGTPEFKQCMTDLNERRCATMTGRHVATQACTRRK